MNVATKVVAHSGWLNSPAIASITLPNFRIILLLLAIFATCMSIVYIKDYNRRLFIQYQNSMQSSTDLNTTYGELLLEQGAWARQARIQNIAQEQLGMSVPAEKDVVTVNVA